MLLLFQCLKLYATGYGGLTQGKGEKLASSLDLEALLAVE